MKQILAILIGIVFAATVGAQPAKTPPPDPGQMLSGEHTPVLYSGSGTIKGSGNSLTTSWLQIGYSPNASEAANANIGRYNPEKFALALKIACYNVGDSARVTTARFEQAYDTTLTAFWNADSSNRFIKSGNFNLGDYGVWRFEVLSDTSRRWLYPLRVLQGGYIRFLFETTTADTASLVWTLTGEH